MPSAFLILPLCGAHPPDFLGSKKACLPTSKGGGGVIRDFSVASKTTTLLKKNQGVMNVSDDAGGGY